MRRVHAASRGLHGADRGGAQDVPHPAADRGRPAEAGGAAEGELSGRDRHNDGRGRSSRRRDGVGWSAGLAETDPGACGEEFGSVFYAVGSVEGATYVSAAAPDTQRCGEDRCG